MALSSDYERLIGRAVADESFREQLLADPDAAVKASGLSLTPDELGRLKGSIAKIKGQENAQQINQRFSVQADIWW
jgi:hypothetical protein